MTSRNTPIENASWLRQLRSWGGILLMVVSLCGGFRSTSAAVEEIETECQTEALEYAHRLSDTGQRTLTRGVRNDLETAHASSDTADGIARRRPADRRVGSTDRSSHVLANGLCAPLRC